MAFPNVHPGGRAHYMKLSYRQLLPIPWPSLTLTTPAASFCHAGASATASCVPGTAPNPDSPPLSPPAEEPGEPLVCPSLGYPDPARHIAGSRSLLETLPVALHPLGPLVLGLLCLELYATGTCPQASPQTTRTNSPSIFLMENKKQKTKPLIPGGPLSHFFNSPSTSCDPYLSHPANLQAQVKALMTEPLGCHI